ncbi:unnamed protein product [Sphenostylis stenocarpa]|uniref:Uncharacterized protein n=1 Tax=Sphenostylis stenocarpa TaxID=92480 RepID=A0AA86SV32_9FABA|nr:unnamed protein product [Sphenostylis stenocarpa]
MLDVGFMMRKRILEISAEALVVLHTGSTNLWGNHSVSGYKEQELKSLDCEFCADGEIKLFPDEAKCRSLCIESWHGAPCSAITNLMADYFCGNARIEPDNVTFAAILSACRHAGLFIVDLFDSAGLVATDIVQNMSSKTNEYMFGSSKFMILKSTQTAKYTELKKPHTTIAGLKETPESVTIR